MASPEQLKHLAKTLRPGAGIGAQKKRSLLRISDLSPEEAQEIIQGGLEAKREPEAFAEALRDTRVALLFQKTSTRTRCSFEIGIFEMAGWPIFIDWSTSNFMRADLRDEIKVLSRYFDLVMARVYRHRDLETMREYSEKPIINGLSDDHHPCQGLTDAMTMLEFFGSLKGLQLTYIGDGNNVLHSLLEVAAVTGIEITYCAPKGYTPQEEIVKFASARTKVRQTESPEDAVKQADVVYTDTWVSMGDEAETETRMKVFAPFQVNEKLMSHAPKHALVMHDLPAHREQEISSAVMDSPNSVVFDQAENRKHLQKFLMHWLLR